MNIVKNQQCPMCKKKTMTLTETDQEIPFFGKCYLFSMKCENCKYNLSDVEAEEQKPSAKYTLETKNQKDLKIRIIKSSTATVKIPQLRMSMEPGPSSIGFISNIEGILNRFEKIIESQKEIAEDDKIKKTAKNLLKKIRKIKYGGIPIKIIIEDPLGNSAIISEKAKIEKLKTKKK